MTVDVTSGSLSDAQSRIDSARSANPSAVLVVRMSGTYTVTGSPLRLPSRSSLTLTGSGATNQQWQIVDLGNGYHRLTARHSGKVLNVAGASTADGANVDQWSWASVNQQQFQLIQVP